MAIKLLQTWASTAPLLGQRRDEFTGENEPQMDFIFTVCDSVAGRPPDLAGQADHGALCPILLRLRAARPIAILPSYRPGGCSPTASNSFSLPIDRIDRLTLSSRLGEIGQATNREN